MRCGSNRRAGMSSLVVLLTLVPLLLLVGLVLYFALLREAKGEGQTGADAAALAAARELACDDMLTADVGRAMARLDRARFAARTLARSNLSFGEPLDVGLNEANQDDGDIVFGDFRTAEGGGRVFAPAGTDPANWAGAAVTAVRVTVSRSPVDAPFGSAPDRKLLARATAVLDFGVVGLRPTNDDPVPLVPVALFPAAKAKDADEWAFDPEKKAFVQGKGDGIPEFRVVLGAPADETVRPGAFLQIGAEDFDATVAQLAGGVGRGSLGGKFAGEFVLGRDNILKLRGSPACPSVGSDLRRRVCAAFGAARDAAEPRVWPLAVGGPGGGRRHAGDEDDAVRVGGFAAARVVAVRGDGPGIELVLQPAAYTSPAVVAERRTPAPEFWANNRTVCRVRLAD